MEPVNPYIAFERLFAELSPTSIVFLAIGAATWLIGGNVLIAFHFKRRGMPMWSGFKPFAFPYANFNAKEWVILALLVIVSMSLASTALPFGND